MYKIICFFITLISLSNAGYAKNECPAGTKAKITKSKNGNITVCVSDKMIKKNNNTTINTITAPYPTNTNSTSIGTGTFYDLNNSNVASNTKIDQTVVKHYYVPLQKTIENKDEEPHVTVSSKGEPVSGTAEKERSYADSFNGFYLGAFYGFGMLNATNNFKSTDSYNTPPRSFSGTENNNILQHGPVGFIGYSNLFFNNTLFFGAEARMGYSVANSSNFNSVTKQVGAYNYHNFLDSIFTYPSVNLRAGVLIAERLLPYFTVGVEVYQLNYNTSPQYTDPNNILPPIQISKSNSVSVNIPIGAGLEFALSTRIHLRLEYLYRFYITQNESFYNGSSTVPNTLTYNYNLNSHTFLLGLSFHF